MRVLLLFFGLLFGSMNVYAVYTYTFTNNASVHVSIKLFFPKKSNAFILEALPEKFIQKGETISFGGPYKGACLSVVRMRQAEEKGGGLIHVPEDGLKGEDSIDAGCQDRKWQIKEEAKKGKTKLVLKNL